MMERLGMHAEIPEVTWDVGGRAGIVLISNQDCAALFLGVFYFLFFFLTKNSIVERAVSRMSRLSLGNLSIITLGIFAQESILHCCTAARGCNLKSLYYVYYACSLGQN
jgi:hypothetical protein